MKMKTSWRELYQATLLELDSQELWKRICSAADAIHQRKAELRRDGAGDGDGAAEEMASLAAALRALRVVAEKECKQELFADDDLTQDADEEAS